jgi:cobalt-zinc-cadmium efflux system outer membrane protein
MRRAAVALIMLASLGLPRAAGAQPQTTEAPLTLERLETLALENNPTVRQAQAEVEAARGRARQAGAWPNPVVGYTAEEVSPGPVIRGGEHGVFIEQAIRLGGKLARSRTIFEREADQAEAALELQRQRIRSAVRVLFYEALTAERRVEVHERLARLVDEAVQVSRQLFNVGAADRPDVLESEVEAARARLQLTAARNRRFAVWRQLAAAAGAPDLRPGPLAATLETAIPELDRAGALSVLLERSPELQAARRGVERARAVVSRARRETFPDLFLRGSVSYNRELLDVADGTPRPVGWEGAFEAGVSVPLFNRNAGGIAAARAEESRAEAEIRRLELALESRLAGVFEHYLTSLRSAEVYRAEVLPRAEEAHRLYLTRFREMGAAYPQVLIAQRTLFQVTDEYLLTVEGAWRAALEIQGFLVSDALSAPPRPGAIEIEQPAGIPALGPAILRGGGER